MGASFRLVDRTGNQWDVQGQMVVGRSNSCDIQVSDAKVSRNHFLLFEQNDQLIIRDSNSGNGTWVNGAHISGDVYLQPGDTIRVGDTEFTVRTTAEARTVLDRERAAAVVSGPEDATMPQSKPKKWFVFAGVGGFLVIGICLVLAVAGILLFRADIFSGEERTTARSSTPVMAVAMRVDNGQPILTAYAADPDSDPLFLPAGTYYIEAFDQNQNIIRTTFVSLGDISLGGEQLELPADFAESGYQDQRHIDDLYTITNFLIELDMARLTYLQIVSDDYQYALYGTPEDIDLGELDRLYAAYDQMLADEESVTAALSNFEWRAQNLSSYHGGGHLARPSRGFVSSFLDFFGYAGGAGERARNDIVQAAATMTAAQREEAFIMVSGNLVNNAANFDEMLEMLASGDLDNNAAQIRKNLMSDPVFGGTIQDMHGSNRPGLAIAHQEGSQLVIKGANLNIDIIKTVLADHFSGIDQGFDYADQINKWSQFANDFYNDPTAALQGLTVEEIKSAINDRIKNDLISAGITEDAAGEMSGILGGQVWDQIKDTVKSEEEEPAPAAPQPQPQQQNAGTYRNFAGTWHSNKACDEPEENYAYTWVITLEQNGEWVTGTLAYHDCPGGGRAFYELEGEATNDKKIILGATLVGGRGDLYGKSDEYMAIELKYKGEPKKMNP